MKTEEFAKAFGEIKDEYLDEACEKKSEKFPLKKFFAVAACICVLLTSTVGVLAAANNVITFAGSHDTTVIGRFGKVQPGTGFSVKMATETIAKEEINTELGWGRSFYKVSDALDYIGCDKIEIPDLGLHQGVTSVSVDDDPKGKAYEIKVYSHYQGDGISFYTTANAKIRETQGTKINHYEEFAAAGEDVEYTHEYFVNKNGIEYLVVKSNVVEDYYDETYDKNQKQQDIYLNAYLVKKGVAYTFSCTLRKVYDEKDPNATKIYDEMIYRDEDNAKYEEYLHKWADNF